jgi:hypothetical protein
LLFFRQATPLICSAFFGHLEVSRLLVESKADVAARSRCFSPPPSHHLSLTICLAAGATLHSKTPSARTKPTLLHTCAASALLNDAPPRAAAAQIKTVLVRRGGGGTFFSTSHCQSFDVRSPSEFEMQNHLPPPHIISTCSDVTTPPPPSPFTIITIHYQTMAPRPSNGKSDTLTLPPFPLFNTLALYHRTNSFASSTFASRLPPPSLRPAPPSLTLLKSHVGDILVCIVRVERWKEYVVS